ncbi:hypothetical protein C7E15_12215 [Stenotrophomonas maltophilia]|uniref:hypothetical protein n=1 Tax=Stenotrophomonas maltophilia group TaxID=995085 RepID=UPI000D424D0E|nr:MULTISPECIES: hypothetical protein [Stenotrophomonas maltophilia group]MCF3498498.1 hypothetical protein [Stenotrophomonas maltophilia]MDQ4682107.1 hypothetical protein [Stenotrophomonas maltophilia group sp. RNC7]PSD16312.1 hypothetical protein C7E15_12215 [Stenotrophomonas maltophilia]UGB20810.1 hypothetical protein LQ335_16410 [Stenotrophomonas maltophilia]
MSDGLSLGIWTGIGAAGGIAVALIGAGLRRFAGYMNAEEVKPRPLMAWCIMLAIVGAVAGTVWQSIGFAECRDAGYKVAECLLPLLRRD